jgi:hypothetical protein
MPTVILCRPLHASGMQVLQARAWRAYLGLGPGNSARRRACTKDRNTLLMRV